MKIHQSSAKEIQIEFKQQQQLNPKLDHKEKMIATTFAMNPSANIVNYIKEKCNKSGLTLTQDQIEKKLMTGETFDIKGQGNDIDTKLMQELLNDNDFYEKHTQKILKDEAMKFICELVQQWSMDIAKHEMRINQDQIHQYTAKLLPFGSYILDLRSHSSDIDLICVCPNFIQRSTHFFDQLKQKLMDKDQVKHLATRENAKVPIITFFFKDINIDISFCQLKEETIPRDIQRTISNDLLKNSIPDDASRKSLFGRKNNLMILDLTGKQLQNFKQTLRVVKVWAKNRGISSNGMGYLGGISWAILVAKICQIFPNHKPAKLFFEFFAVYNIWNWKVPVRINAPSGLVENESKISNPLMSVTTPADEYNSTERVNMITEKVLVDQIKRASQILYAKRDIVEVCKKVDFFNIFPLFIEIDIIGPSNSKEDEKDYKDFQGTVESRLLRLLQVLIRQERGHLEEQVFRVVPFPKIFKKNDAEFPQTTSLFLGLDLTGEIEIDIARCVKEWVMSIDLSRINKLYNLKIFETIRDEIVQDVEITEPKKPKEQKEDPRLAMMRKKKAAENA